MTYTETCEHFTRLSVTEVAAMKRSPFGFAVGSDAAVSPHGAEAARQD